MPIGDNLFKFKSDKAKYSIALQTNSPIKNPHYPTFNFTIADPVAFFNYNVTTSAELESFPYDRLKHNLTYTTNGFEFNSYEDGSEIRNGAVASASLSIQRKPSWNLNYLITFDEYEAPIQPIFELGSDVIDVTVGTGSVINPTNYDLNFGAAQPINPTGYDLNFAPADDVVTKSESWDFVASFYGTSFEADLTITRNVLHNDMSVVGYPTGAGVIAHPINYEPMPVDNDVIVLDQRILDQNLEFRFDELEYPSGTNDMLFHPMRADSEFDVNVGFDGLPVPPEHSNSPNFNLSEGGGSLDFNLRTQIRAESLYGKNLNYNVLICPDDVNPPLDSPSHAYEFKADFLDKTCGELILNFVHGSSMDIEFDKTIIIREIDQYHGMTATADISLDINLGAVGYGGQHLYGMFSTYPSAKMDVEFDYGSNVDFDLLTIAIIRDVDVRYGIQFKEVELETYLAPEFKPNAYSGFIGNVEILTEPILQVEDALHGTFNDGDLTVYPSIELVADGYHGSIVDAPVVTYAIISADAYHGIESATELDIIKSEGIGFVENYHGSNTEVDLAYTPTLDSEGYHGIYSYGELSHAATLNADGYHGAYADTDFTLNPFDQIDSDAAHGSYSVFDLSMTKALFPRANHGIAGVAELYDRPAIDVTTVSRHGATLELDTLEETDFNVFGHHGATMEDFNLQITVNIPVDITHGAVSELDEIKRGASLDMDAFSGHNGVLSNFVVPAGETILANAYAGASLTPNLHAPIHARLNLYPIVGSQTLYDGLGGVGGINHCYLSSRDLDPAFGDNVTRLGYDPLGIQDQLIVRFDDIGDDPWSTCNSGGMIFDLEFQTNPRLEAQAYSGESVKAYFPLEVMALIGNDVPLDRLYRWEYWASFEREVFELEEIQYQTTGAVWDHPDDVVVFYEAYFSAELTPTAFAPMYHGAHVATDLVVPVYAWKVAQQPIETGEHAAISFEPVDYIRFCKGYIIPNGNSVVFEFDRDDDSTCDMFIGAHGAGMVDFDIEVHQVMGSQNFNGQHTRATLTIDPYWTLYARHGAHLRAQLYDEPEFELNVRHGSNTWAEFYVPPIYGHGGHNVFIDELTITGPSIRWETESACLPNEFKPTTPDGDIDTDAMKPDENGVEHYLEVPVEGKPYLTNLLANCITFDDSGS